MQIFISWLANQKQFYAKRIALLALPILFLSFETNLSWSMDNITLLDTDDTSISNTEEVAKTKANLEGLKLFIHYKPEPWNKRLRILNEIRQRLRKQGITDDLMQKYLATPTELHFTLAWGRILPVYCTDDISCKITPLPKKALSDISDALNDITIKSGKSFSEGYRWFRSLFHYGSRKYLFESYPLSSWEEEELSKFIIGVASIFEDTLDKKFSIPVEKEASKKDLVHKFHLLMGKLNQKVLEDITFYDVSLVQDRLLTEAKKSLTSNEKEDDLDEQSPKTETIESFCDNFIEEEMGKQLQNTQRISVVVKEINSLLKSFDKVKFKNFHRPKEVNVSSFESVDIDKFIDWDLEGQGNQEKISKAKSQCVAFIKSAQNSNLINFYDSFKNHFVRSFSDTPLGVMGSPQDFSHGEKVITVLQVNQDTEENCRSRYIEFLKPFLPKEEFLPTQEIPLKPENDKENKERGLDVWTPQIKDINFEKKYCFEGNSGQCFVLLAEKEYYNGQWPFNYHMTILNKTLGSKNTEEQDLANNELKEIHNTLKSLKDLDQIKDLGDLEIKPNNIRFYDHQVISARIYGSDVPRHNREILADEVLVKIPQEEILEIEKIGEDKKETEIKERIEGKFKDHTLLRMSLNDAIKLAQSEEKVLVEVEPNSNPPICEILSFEEYISINTQSTMLSSESEIRKKPDFIISAQPKKEISDREGKIVIEEESLVIMDLDQQLMSEVNSEALAILENKLETLSPMGMPVTFKFPSKEHAEANINYVKEFFENMLQENARIVSMKVKEVLDNESKETHHIVEIFIRPTPKILPQEHIVKIKDNVEFNDDSFSAKSSKTNYFIPKEKELKELLEKNLEDSFEITIVVSFISKTISKSHKGKFIAAFRKHLNASLGSLEGVTVEQTSPRKEGDDTPYSIIVKRTKNHN